MKIENYKKVSLIYELREKDGQGRIIEALDNSRPLTFISGTGRLLPDFEANINNLDEGENFAFALPSDKAYGDRREEMVVDVPISVFEVDGVLNEDICKVGNEVPMADSDGNPLTGIINEISESFVKMDFNHPMAGVDLYFTGQIVAVSEPTEKELAATLGSCSSCGSEGHSGCSGGCS